MNNNTMRYIKVILSDTGSAGDAVSTVFFLFQVKTTLCSVKKNLTQMGSVAKATSLPVYPVSVSFLSRRFPVVLLTVPGSDPSLTSDPVPSPAAAPPACRRGAASSPAAAVAARSTACVVAGAAAGAGATRTPPTGATAAAHLGTPSLARAAAAGVTGR